MDQEKLIASDQWLEIGTILTSHGLKGELKVSSTSDFPERFEQPGQRLLLSPDQTHRQLIQLLKGRYIPGKKTYVIQLEGISDRAQAEAFRNYKLFIDANERPQLAEDEYHVSDLINLEVYHQITGEAIGIVKDLRVAGNDLLEVELYSQPNLTNDAENKPKTAFIPFVKAIVPVVDLERKRIEIVPPAGLLEL